MKYRKKPVVIEAVHFNGTNSEEIREFIGGDFIRREVFGKVLIRTLEGSLEASPGDYIIRGVQGEHYPCKPDIFELTYEAVE